MSRTRSFRSLARRSASTLPANPAPTIIQSYIQSLRRCRGIDRQGRGRTVRDRSARNVQHQFVHVGPGLVPGTGREMAVDLGKPVLLGPRQDEFGLLHDVSGAPCDLDKTLVAVGPDDVGD